MVVVGCIEHLFSCYARFAKTLVTFRGDAVIKRGIHFMTLPKPRFLEDDPARVLESLPERVRVLQNEAAKVVVGQETKQEGFPVHS